MFTLQKVGIQLSQVGLWVRGGRTEKGGRYPGWWPVLVVHSVKARLRAKHPDALTQSPLRAWGRPLNSVGLKTRPPTLTWRSSKTRGFWELLVSIE